MTYLEEFFSSADERGRLVQLLESASFSPLPEWRKVGDEGFEADNVRIYVQHAREGMRSVTGHKYCLLVELNQPLPEIPMEHPLRTFFRNLNDPHAYGIMGMPPQYQIEEYVLNS